MLVAALGGALIALAGTSYGTLRADFAFRVGALQLLLAELKGARETIEETLESGSLWPAGDPVVPRAWRENRSRLASHLSRDTWNEIQDLARHLEQVDRRVDDLRRAGSPINDPFRAEFEALARAIGKVTGDSDLAAPNLNDAIRGARGLPLVLRAVIVVLVGACILGVLYLALHKPIWTADSLSRSLHDRTPSAAIVACNADSQLDGAYACAVTFPPCALGRVSANRRAACSPPLEVTYSVQTHASCYAASRTTEVMGADPPGPFLQRLRKLWVITGCGKL